MSDLNLVSELGHPQDGGRGRGVCVDIKRGGWHLVETDQGATPAYVVLDKVTIQHVQGVLACQSFISSRSRPFHLLCHSFCRSVTK